MRVSWRGSKLRSRLELRTLRQPSNSSRGAAARAVEHLTLGRGGGHLARTKHLAKIASQVVKPDGLVIVDAETELHFLHALPVGCPGCQRADRASHHLGSWRRRRIARLNADGENWASPVSFRGHFRLSLLK